MHVWTRLKPESVGVTGIGLYPDGMVEHDKAIGTVLAKLEELGIIDNTIIMYSTDNGAEKFTWPDGGTTPFAGEKGSTWEGGFRVPSFIRWPGVIEPGSIYNDIFSHEDMMPTLLAAAGVPDVKEKLLEGYQAGDKNFKIHLDGYNMMPYFNGEVEEAPRKEIFYFDAGGNLNAVRYKDWKIHFTIMEGSINEGSHSVTMFPTHGKPFLLENQAWAIGHCSKKVNTSSAYCAKSRISMPMLPLAANVPVAVTVCNNSPPSPPPKR